MKKLLLSLLLAFSTLAGAYAQNAITLPFAAQTVADVGNGPVKVRVTQGNASIFTSQGSGVGSTSGASVNLTLTAVPTTAPCVGCQLSGSGITSGTTVAAYNGATSITMSAAMTVPANTTVSWGAACPASAAGIPTQYIRASVMADYYLLYTQARVCAVSPGGPANTLLILPIFYDSTSPTTTSTSSGGSGAVSSVFGRSGAVVATAGDYSFSQLSGALACGQLPTFTGDVTNVACALTIGATKVTAAMLAANAAASNVGTLSGVLSGTLPSPGWANANANTVLSNWTAGAAAPIFNTWPSCANDGAHALVYVNGSGLVCGSITAGSGTVTSITLASSTSITLTGTCTVTTSGTCTIGTATPIALLNTADQALSGGTFVTSLNLGTISSGTTTIDCGARPNQYLTNNGAFTLALPTAHDGSCTVQITNGASAGAVSITGGTVNSAFTGGALTTTNGNKFKVFIDTTNGSATYYILPQQ